MPAEFVFMFQARTSCQERRRRIYEDARLVVNEIELYQASKNETDVSSNLCVRIWRAVTVRIDFD